MIWQTRAELHSKYVGRILPRLTGRPIEGTITRSDFGSDLAQTYLTDVETVLSPVLDRFIREHGYGVWILHRVWFQHYEPGDSHDWHTHSGCNFAGTYVLQGQGATEISTQAQQLEALAGTVTIFPAYTAHRAPPILEPRTVIAFNLSVEEPEG